MLCPRCLCIFFFAAKREKGPWSCDFEISKFLLRGPFGSRGPTEHCKLHGMQANRPPSQPPARMLDCGDYVKRALGRAISKSQIFCCKGPLGLGAQPNTANFMGCRPIGPHHKYQLDYAAGDVPSKGPFGCAIQNVEIGSDGGNSLNHISFDQEYCD